jgi:hypothetical protein
LANLTNGSGERFLGSLRFLDGDPRPSEQKAIVVHGGLYLLEQGFNNFLKKSLSICLPQFCDGDQSVNEAKKQIEHCQSTPEHGTYHASRRLEKSAHF